MRLEEPEGLFTTPINDAAKPAVEISFPGKPTPHLKD
jgi:hypothetical protein